MSDEEKEVVNTSMEFARNEQYDQARITLLVHVLRTTNEHTTSPEDFKAALLLLYYSKRMLAAIGNQLDFGNRATYAEDKGRKKANISKGERDKIQKGDEIEADEPNKATESKELDELDESDDSDDSDESSDSAVEEFSIPGKRQLKRQLTNLGLTNEAISTLITISGKWRTPRRILRHIKKYCDVSEEIFVAFFKKIEEGNTEWKMLPKREREKPTNPKK